MLCYKTNSTQKGPGSPQMNEGSFFMHASCCAADKELVVGGENMSQDMAV